MESVWGLKYYKFIFIYKLGEQALELALWYKQSSLENWINLQNTIQQQQSLKNEYDAVTVCINPVQYT